MDIDLLRTFVEITESSHFVRAAERLNVTQSTVSARVKELEARLGRTLFVRGRSGAVLTAAGRHFRPHAEAMLRSWRRARQEVALPEAFETVLSVGGQYTLWDRVLQLWVAHMRRTDPGVALRAEVARPDELTRLLFEGGLDIAVLYAPQPRAGLCVEPLLEERLVLVSTGHEGVWPGDPGYVMVDWGAEFGNDHAAAFPDVDTPALTVGLGAVALNHILHEGGGAYFPFRVVRRHLAAGELHPVAAAPEFTRPAFIVWQNRDDPALARAVGSLRAVATAEVETV
ncbi:MAG: LysR family transcriptional regulator [Alphaproteobacteria bacterium]|nr:LysR family transcriptional regulator [Alphaproteobacteria bacterium]